MGMRPKELAIMPWCSERLTLLLEVLSAKDNYFGSQCSCYNKILLYVVLHIAKHVVVKKQQSLAGPSKSVWPHLDQLHDIAWYWHMSSNWDALCVCAWHKLEKACIVQYIYSTQHVSSQSRQLWQVCNQPVLYRFHLDTGVHQILPVIEHVYSRARWQKSQNRACSTTWRYEDRCFDHGL